MLSSQFCQSARRGRARTDSGRTGSPPVSTTLTSRPATVTRRVHRRPVDVHPGARRRRRRRSSSGPGRSSPLSDRPAELLTPRRHGADYRINARADRHRHRQHAAPLLGPARAAAKRRFGVELPYAEQLEWTIDAAAAGAGQGLRRRDPHGRADPRRRALRGRGGDDPRLARGGPLHPRHLAPPGGGARRHRAVAGADRRCPTTSSTLVGQGRPLPRDRHRAADRRLAGEPARRARRRDRRRHARAPVEPGGVRGRGGHRLRRRLGGARRSASRRCWRGHAGERPPEGPAGALGRAARPPARDRARPPGHRLGPLGARRGPDGQDALRLALPLLVPLRGRGHRARARPPAARCWSPTTPARSRPTRR